MKVHFNKDDKPEGSFLCSRLSWTSPDFEKGINLAFRVKSNEKIHRLVINADGIRAYFKKKVEA